MTFDIHLNVAQSRITKGEDEDVFSTRSYAADSRIPAWCDVLAAHCGPFQIKARHDLEATVERSRIGVLTCTRMTQNSQSMTRTSREIRQTRQDNFYVMMQVAGRARVTQDDADFTLSPGAIAIVDASRPLHFAYDGKNMHLALHVPHDLLRCAAAPIRATMMSDATSGLIGALMQTALGHADNIDPDCGEVVQNSVLSLLRVALAKPGKSGDQADPSNECATFRSVRHYVSRNLQGDLSVAAIARNYGMSVRQLYRAFESSDLSLAGVIRRARLERCAADLRNPLLSEQTITSIAFNWGFNDSAHFSRTFKDEFGQAPRDYRLSALDRPASAPAH